MEIERIKAEIEKSQSKGSKAKPPAKRDGEEAGAEKGGETAEVPESKAQVEKAEAEGERGPSEAGKA
jgi:hypothetical protein